jgi:hypothetical protein
VENNGNGERQKQHGQGRTLSLRTANNDRYVSGRLPMKTTIGALILTVLATTVGFFLLGYCYSEWWAAKPPVVIKGVWWESAAIGNMIEERHWLHNEAELARDCPTDAVAFALPKDWIPVATIGIFRGGKTLPARSCEARLLDVVGSLSLKIGYNYKVYVEPAGAPDNLGNGYRGLAKYAVSIREGKVFQFQAKDRSEAINKARALIWKEQQEMLRDIILAVDPMTGRR